MGHGLEPGCKCSSCKRLGKIRLAELEEDEKYWVWPDYTAPTPKPPEPKVYEGYFNKPGDEPGKGRIVQRQHLDGSITYKFIQN